MPSMLHELLVRLFQKRPEILPQLLEQAKDVELPEGVTCQVVPANLSTARPIELRADAVVEMRRGNETKMVGIVEVQLWRDDTKPKTWAHYSVSASIRHECPAVVVVFCTKKRVAEWAAQWVHLGPRHFFQPIVIGPDALPRIDDPEEAARNLELAVLSAVVHENEEGGLEVFKAVTEAMHSKRLVDEATLEEYTTLLLAAMTAELRHEVRQMIERGELRHLEDFTRPFYERGLARGRAEGLREGEERGLARGRAEGLREGEERGLARGRAEGRVEGRVEGLREALVQQLEARGWRLGAKWRERIAACADPDRLLSWLGRVNTAEDLDSVFVAVGSNARRGVPLKE